MPADAARFGSARPLGASARQHVVAGAAAAADLPTVPATQVPFLSDPERKAYAESIGFKTVGKHLPDDVTLQQVIQSMPPEVGATSWAAPQWHIAAEGQVWKGQSTRGQQLGLCRARQGGAGRRGPAHQARRYARAGRGEWRPAVALGGALGCCSNSRGRWNCLSVCVFARRHQCWWQSFAACGSPRPAHPPASTSACSPLLVLAAPSTQSLLPSPHIHSPPHTILTPPHASRAQVFELNPWRAWSAVAISIVSFALAEYLIAIAPWPLLPLAWAFAGTAFTGWFVVGHDCAHR